MILFLKEDGLNFDHNCIHIPLVLLTSEMMPRMLSRKTDRWVLRHNAYYHVNFTMLFLLLFLHILQYTDSVIISNLIL